ncbi:MAG: cytochrome P450 [Myxococcota bacterium]
MRRNTPMLLPPQYAELRRERPVARVSLAYDGQEVWLVTRHREACQVLADPRTFSSDFARPGFPHRMTPDAPPPGTFIRLDPPDHTRLRNALSVEFKADRIEKLRPLVQRVVDQIIDGILEAGPPTDLIQSVALPMPTMVISELLGVPFEDREFFHARVQVIGQRNKTRERHQEVRSELEDYIAHLVDLRDRDPADDLVSRLLQRSKEHGDITREEAAGIATLLLIAGYETLANMIGLGTATLLRYPEQMEALRRDPSMMNGAIEELLRFQTVIAFGLRRACTRDTRIGDVEIKEGDGVIVVLDSANRDETKFDNPDTVNLMRKAPHHLAFGFGLHACIGQQLARMELSVLWNTMLRRLPGLTLAMDFDELPFRNDTFVYGVNALPVRWTTSS